MCIYIFSVFLSLWLCWVFAEFQAFSSFGKQGLPCSHGLLVRVASLVEQGL